MPAVLHGNREATVTLLMIEMIQLGDIAIAVTRKDITNVHPCVHPPGGRVTLVAPTATRLEVARAYAISKLGWIRDQQAKLSSQAREAPRRYVERESHYLWGRRYLLTVLERDVKPSVPSLIQKWERRLKVTVDAYSLQRMKTKWGSCNHRASSIRLNTELIKKPKDLLEYVIVHEIVHLIVHRHDVRFVALMDRHYPTRREARAELNELPSLQKPGAVERADPSTSLGTTQATVSEMDVCVIESRIRMRQATPQDEWNPAL